ncbi:MAG: hypothetical protein HY557_08205, partial [Euryarchaeota archaeon]|nr:hypothetical protein [Euryarchaeota archaeon]
MRLGRVSGLFAAAIVGLVVLMVLSGIPAAAAAPTPSEEPRQAGGATLLVGGQDEMKVRNWLPPRANDVWTADVLFRAYDSVLQGHPTEDRLLAWIAKGVDFDEDGIFEASEYNVFAETAGAATPLEITFYYDFNGVRWHDGTQMTPWDLFFSSHVTAMCPRCTSDFRALYTGGSGISYDAGGRQLNIVPVDLNPATPELEKNWEGESAMAGDANLRVAVEFTLTEPFALFYESAATSPVMMPIHLWAGTGGGKHADLKCAVWLPPSEATARGAPQCGNADPTKWGRGIPKTDPQGYDFEAAAAWTPGDRDVVGHGPFKFDTWISGVEAKVVRNDDFYTGIDAVTGTVYD